jgi:hypothetical protein
MITRPPGRAPPGSRRRRPRSPDRRECRRRFPGSSGSTRRAGRSRARRSRAACGSRRACRRSFLGRALREALEQHVPVADLELEDDVEVAPEPSQELVERLGLRSVARKAVENEARNGVAAIEPRLDQLDDGRVVDEIASVVDLLDPPSELGVELLDLADHVAGGDLRDAVGGRDELRLSSFAGPLRAEKQQVHATPPECQNDPPP